MLATIELAVFPSKGEVQGVKSSNQPQPNKSLGFQFKYVFSKLPPGSPRNFMAFKYLFIFYIDVLKVTKGLIFF